MSGQIDALVAMKCLDEGVDIPDVRSGIMMASTQNPRQFVQRRGRLLRKAPGKSRATIYDLLVMPPADHSPSDSELTLIGNELSRAYELAAGFRSRGVTVVLGGPHVTLVPDEAQAHADSIVVE